MRLYLAGILTLFSLSAQMQAAEHSTVWEVIEAYEREALPRMSASAEIHRVITHYVDGKVFGEPEDWNLFWAKRGEQQRLRYNHPLPGIADYYTDGVSSWRLYNWDPEHPHPLTPRNQGRVRGAVIPRTGEYLGLPFNYFLLWAFSVANIDTQEYSLRDLYLIASESSLRPVGDQLEIVLSKLDGQFTGRGYHPENTVSITFDPAHHYRCVRSEARVYPTLNNPFNGGRLVIEAVEFFDGELDMLPKQVRVETTYDTAESGPLKKSIGEYTLTSARTAVDADFEFDFPANLQVTTGLSESPQHTQLVLWGPDIREIRSLDDLPPEPDSENGLGPAGESHPPVGDH